eukprot:s907_g3.t1
MGLWETWAETGQKLDRWCQEHIQLFSDQSLANIVSSFGMLRINLHPSFLASVERQVLERLKASDHAALVVFFRATIQCPQLARLEGQLAWTVAQELLNFKSKELRSLAFTRSVKLGIVHQEVEPNMEELHRWCMELAHGVPQERRQEQPEYQRDKMNVGYEAGGLRPHRDSNTARAPSKVPTFDQGHIEKRCQGTGERRSGERPKR